jgi:hypoxanthine phosphoribosyltransferase
VNKQHLRWSEIDELVDILCKKIIIYSIDGVEIKDLWGLPRGGLIPTVMISHRLGIPVSNGTISPNTLIIDDICDSGKTFKEYFDYYQIQYSYPFNLKTACLNYKPQTSSFQPTLWANQWDKKDWIVYPWERKDSKTIQDYKI